MKSKIRSGTQEAARGVKVWAVRRFFGDTERPPVYDRLFACLVSDTDARVCRVLDRLGKAVTTGVSVVLWRKYS